jgi:DNA repair and recombination protein RAD54B
MGSAAWKGEPLYSGLNLLIGGKEVELDSKVEASQLPTLVGMSRDSMGVEMDGVGLYEPKPFSTSNIFLSPTPAISPEVAKFVAPTSFYGTPNKPKPKGPLYVRRKQLSITPTDCT